MEVWGAFPSGGTMPLLVFWSSGTHEISLKKCIVTVTQIYSNRTINYMCMPVPGKVAAIHQLRFNSIYCAIIIAKVLQWHFIIKANSGTKNVGPYNEVALLIKLESISELCLEVHGHYNVVVLVQRWLVSLYSLLYELLCKVNAVVACNVFVVVLT